MKKQLFLFALMMLPLVASAITETVKIDGIYYKLNSEKRTAEVTSDPDYINKYSGSVVIPESVISKSARYSVTSIVGAFSGCTDLISVTIPNSVLSIGNGAFRGCSGLTSVTIPISVTSIGDGAFERCSGLSSITIPNGVTSIGEDAFRECSGLASVIIPNSVISIGKYAFANCCGLTSITIPNSVTSINGAFAGCSGLASVTIPNSVTSIGEDAFARCSGLTSITITNNVTYIDESAFHGCTGLTSLTIPNSVTTICHEAFEDCKGLTYVIIGNGVTTIGSEAFKDCDNLNYVIIGSSVTTIEGTAFRNCDKLTDVYCYAETVPTTNSSAFYNTYIENATLHVPEVSIGNYKNAAPWSGFGSIVALNGDVVPVTIRKCETPTISFVNGEITFTCKTDGVKYISQITASDAKNYYESNIVLTNKYTVSVYASKVGYDNSDTVTKEITIGGNSGEGSGVFGDINGDGVVDAADIVQIANIIMGK